MAETRFLASVSKTQKPGFLSYLFVDSKGYCINPVSWISALE